MSSCHHPFCYLQEARASSQQVVVLCHLCFHPRTCAGACLLWNYDEVLQVRRAPDLCGPTSGA